MDSVDSADQFTRWCTGVIPYKFEEIVARIIQESGKSTETTPRSGDGGVDVVVYDSDPASSDLPSRVDALVQVKQKSGIYSSVDATPLEKLIEIAPQYDPNRLVIVTTGKFGGPVTDKAAHVSDYEVDLIHTDELYERTSKELLSKLVDEYESHPGQKNWW
ncbi:restriction endonuclease (plasmid) [Haloarcula salina]|uniref:restriction endonuclease n=1 Tax=Haloarcula salina TaxID=1429914 RepID=UPI003C7005BF